MNQFSRPLSDFLNRSDGLDKQQALDRATLYLEAMRGRIERGLDDAIGAIGALCDDATMTLPARAHTLYTLADGILGVAETFQRKTVGDIAFSLCDLMQVFERTRTWDSNAVRAHYNAMRLVQANPDLTLEERGELLSNLSGMVKLLALRNGVSHEHTAATHSSAV